MTRTRLVIVALVLLLGTNGWLVFSAVDGSGRIAAVAHQAQQTSVQTKQLLVAGRHQRLVTTGRICHLTNKLAAKIKALIVGGAVSSRAFDKLFRQYHYPPYRTRLATAYKQARSLDLVDCTSLNIH